MTTLAPSVTHRDPKGRKFISIIETAYDKADLSEAEAQRINDTSGLTDLVASFIEEHRLTDRFKDEEVSSNYTYPGTYTGPKPIEEQIKAVALIFGLDQAEALKRAENLPKLPKGAEGWFAIPKVDAVARVHFPEVEDLEEKHCRAICLALEKLKASRPFYNWREGKITPDHVRSHARTEHALDILAEEQDGDILIVAAQLGLRHRGRSVRRAREVIANTPGEFGLNSFAVVCVTLTHPERETQWEQLHMDCPGDEFAPGAGGAFSSAFGLGVDDFGGGGVGFDADRVDGPDADYGSASGFLSQ